MHSLTPLQYDYNYGFALDFVDVMPLSTDVSICLVNYNVVVWYLGVAVVCSRSASYPTLSLTCLGL